jgi:cell division protein FtsW (lipid II flippase)
MIPREFDRLLALSKSLLESREIERVILPTIVDALVEREGASSKWIWRWKSQLRLLYVIGAALVVAMAERSRVIPWVSLSTLGLAGLCGAIVLQGRTELRPSPIAHCIYVGIAVLLAIFVLVVPAKLALVLRNLAYGVVGIALLLCPWFGRAFEDQKQWLAIGPLLVHVASIGLPVFAVFSFHALERRNYARYLIVASAVSLLLGLQPNFPDLCLYLVIAAVCALQHKPSWLVGLTWSTSGLGTLVLLRHFLDASQWERLGLAAIGAVLMRMLWVFTSQQRRGTVVPTSRLVRGMSLGSVLCVVLIAREIAGDGVPLLSAGASIMIGVFVLFATAMRAAELVRP